MRLKYFYKKITMSDETYITFWYLCYTTRILKSVYRLEVIPLRNDYGEGVISTNTKKTAGETHTWMASAIELDLTTFLFFFLNIYNKF